MSPPTAVEVMRLARMGLGHEDIIVKLKGQLDARDREEIKRFVLRMPRCAKRTT